MKTRYILTLALGTMIAFACNKEEIEQPEIVPETPKTEGLTEIKAEIVETKTTYDVDGKFSWLSTDKITVVVYNSGTNELNHYTFSNSTGNGTSATFTGGPVADPYVEEGFALYPNPNDAAAGTVSLDKAGAHDTGVQVVKRQEITPNLSNPMAAIPLIGRKNGSGIYQFKTAVGVLKVTVTDIPADAKYLYLYDPSGTYPFSGKFAIGDLSELRAADAVSPSGNDFKTTINFTPEAAGETRVFYIPVPTGTIPAGVQLKMDKGYPSFANIFTKTTTKEIPVTANHVTPLAAIAAETWNNVGTGKFMDDDGFYATGYYGRTASDFINVTIEQHASDASRYRIVNPYQAYIDAQSKTPMVGAKGPDSYLYFTLKDGYVDFDTYRCGLDYYSYYGEFAMNSPKAKGYSNYWNNTVIKYAGDGVTPLNIQLAPIYTTVADGSVLASCHQNPKIEIVFPSSSPMLTEGANYANRGTVTCSNNTASAVLGTDVGEIKAVAASDLASGVAAIKADAAGVLTFTTSESQDFAGLADGTYRLVYRVSEGDGTHGFTFKDGGDFTVYSGVKIDLSTCTVSPIATETSEGSVAYLYDGNTSTYWHSPWSVAGTYDSTYGIYIDVDLGSGNEVTKFKARFHLRNSLNDHPDHIKIYASTDGSSWGSALADVSGIYSTYGQNSWTDFVPFTAASASRYVRIAILQSTGDNGEVSDLTSTGCTHLAELELYNMD